MKKTIVIMMVLILTMTLLMGTISYAGDDDGSIDKEVKTIKDTIIKLLKEIGISIMIIVIAIIGFGMLFGGGNDIAKYKMHFLILLIGAILIFKADTIGIWVNDMLTK